MPYRQLRGSHQPDDSPLTLAAWKLAASGPRSVTCRRDCRDEDWYRPANQVRGVPPTVIPDWAVRAERAGFLTLFIVGRCTYPGVMDTVALMAAAGAPTTCMGSNEVSCAIGLARIATLTAPTAQAATDTIQQAVTSTPGVTAGPIASEGPGNIGKHGGYRRRFAQGNREFSAVLVWVSDALTPRNRTPSTTSWPPFWSPVVSRPGPGRAVIGSIRG